MTKVPPLTAYTRTLGQLLALATPTGNGSVRFPNDVDTPPWVEALVTEAAPHTGRDLALLRSATAAVERGESVYAFAARAEPQSPGDVVAFFRDTSTATLASIDEIFAGRAPLSAWHLARLCIDKQATVAYRLVSAGVALVRDLHAEEIAKGTIPIDLPSEAPRPRIAAF